MTATHDSALLSIGEVARRAGVSARTIRLYEGLGILPVPDRSPGGTRRYNREYQFYIEGALLLKDLGFSLEEVKLVGRLARHAPMTSAERRCARQAIAAKMTSLDHRIRVLQRLRDVLPMASRDGDCLATLVSIAGRAEITR